MADFINTIDLLGDDVVMDSIIERTLTEFNDDILTQIKDGAFEGCANLATVNLPNLIRINGNNAFQNSGLVSINLPSAVDLGIYTFRNCTKLVSAVFPKATKIFRNSMENCTSLRTVDFGSKIIIAEQLFWRDSAFTALILRSEDMCPLIHTDAFDGTPIANGTGHIYVPRALIEDYKVAANWSTYASQFRVLEDYTVDGTTTGELDESKI